MSNIRQFLSGAGGLKSVQRGSTSLNNVASISVTISSVNLNKSFLIFSFSTKQTSNLSRVFTRGRIVNSTTITFNKATATGIVDIDWQVVEFY